MPAIDTVFASVANPSGTFTAAVAAPGDSLSVRSFNFGSDYAYLEQILRRGATKGQARVRSPRLHDSSTGVIVDSAEVVHSLGLPQQAFQPLYPSDTLIAEVTGGAAETDGVGLCLYYSNLPGVAARLASWGDISGIIKSIKPFVTAVTASATIGNWVDTLVTTTDNQLHSDADYAVLGYATDVALGMVGIKGADTGNLRACGPGSTNNMATADWFVRWSQLSGYGAIPIFNANNRFATYVSVVDVAASTAANITLICAELSQPAPV
jgi:hypothetical protein